MENLITTRKWDEERACGRQRRKIINGLTELIGKKDRPVKGTIRATGDHEEWRDMFSQHLQAWHGMNKVKPPSLHHNESTEIHDTN